MSDMNNMNDNDRMDQWQARNEGYLSAALEWLRLRLTGMARNGNGGEDSTGTGAAAVTEAQIHRAASALMDAETADPPPALVILGRRFGLSRFERDVFFLCAAMELDTRVPVLCARAQDDPQRNYPTFALAMALFDNPAWDVLSPERPLRYWRLLEVNPLGAQSLVTSPLRVDERMVNYIKGLNYLDDRLSPMLVPFEVPGDAGGLPESQQEIVNTICRNLETGMDGSPPPVTQLVGIDSISKQLVAQQAAGEVGYHLNRMPVELLPTQASDLETLARLWQRESYLLPIALYLDAHEPVENTKHQGGGQSLSHPLQRFLVRSRGVFFVSSREMHSDLGPLTTTVEVKKPTPTEQQTVWTHSLGNTSNGSPSQLAGQFNLNVSTIRGIVKRLKEEPDINGSIPHDRLWKSCLVSTGPKLELLARKLEPKATWDDIVLPEESLNLLKQVAGQVSQRSKVYDQWGFRAKMNRGLGINALFAGDSGTGKTMAAEVIANALQLNLYRIDLSGVVSKYIGETEKNLRRLFDAAEDGGAILFFDEADALFGKRSEVKDSHDRYANIEINYLLQRMESYNGLAILATNMRSALDSAFMRRLRFIIDFPFPGIKERREIMGKVFPSGVPLGNLDYDRLARLNLTGGSINNVAINAAFLAAHAGVPVSMPMVLEAAKAEFRKMERPIRESDFLWSEPGEVVL